MLCSHVLIDLELFLHYDDPHEMVKSLPTLTQQQGLHGSHNGSNTIDPVLYPLLVPNLVAWKTHHV